MDEILDANEAATLLKIHLKTLYKLSEKGLVPGGRVGRSWRYKRGDLLALIGDQHEGDQHGVREEAARQVGNRLAR